MLFRRTHPLRDPVRRENPRGRALDVHRIANDRHMLGCASRARRRRLSASSVVSATATLAGSGLLRPLTLARAKGHYFTSNAKTRSAPAICSSLWTVPRSTNVTRGFSFVKATITASREGAATVTAPTTPTTLGQWVAGLMPTNALRAAADGTMLPLVVISLTFALALGGVAPKTRQP